jgi:hypothetical protein
MRGAAGGAGAATTRRAAGDAGGATTTEAGGTDGLETAAAPAPEVDGTRESAWETAVCAGPGTTGWLSAPEPGPAASDPAGMITASVTNAVASAPSSPRSFPIR